MNYIEKLLKKRFDNGRSEEGVNPDELWAEISPLLPPSSPTPKASLTSRSFFLFLFLLGLVGIGSIYYFGYYNSPPTIETSAKSTAISSQPSILQGLPTAIVKVKKGSKTEASLSSSSHLQSTVKSHSIFEKSSVFQSTPGTESALRFESPATEVELIKQANSFSPALEKKVPAYIESSSSANRKTTINYDNTILSSLPLPFTVQSDQHPKQTTPWVQMNEKLTSSPPIKEIQLGLFSGINIWRNRFSNKTTATEQVAQANNFSLGNTYAAELQLRLGTNIGIVSGIAYNRTHHQFKLVQSWDTLMYRNNIPGSDLINALATRTVKNYNSLHFFSIPVLISSSKAFNRIAIGLDAGISLNYVAVQNGKTLNSNNEIVTYPSSESSKLPYSDFFIAYQFRPFINYKLSDNIRLQLRPELSLQQFGSSDLYDTKHNALLMGLSFGGLYSL